jgi:hypothetical protein
MDERIAFGTGRPTSRSGCGRSGTRWCRTRSAESDSRTELASGVRPKPVPPKPSQEGRGSGSTGIRTPFPRPTGRPQTEQRPTRNLEDGELADPEREEGCPPGVQQHEEHPRAHHAAAQTREELPRKGGSRAPEKTVTQHLQHHVARSGVINLSARAPGPTRVVEGSNRRDSGWRGPSPTPALRQRIPWLRAANSWARGRKGCRSSHVFGR